MFSKKNSIHILLLLVVFLFAFAIRVHHLTEKKGFHEDEVYSYMISTNPTVGFWENRGSEFVEYTGRELKEHFLKLDPSLGAAVKDLFALWKTNKDQAHTNFYYSLYRVSLIGLQADDIDVFIDKLMFRLGALNLIIFTFSFIALYVLLRLLLKEKDLILLGLCVAFFNVIDLSSFLFFRPYYLQGLFTVVFSGYLIYVYQKIKKDEYVDSWQNMVLFGFFLSLMLFSGYYSFVYAFCVGLGFALFPLRKYKRLKSIPFFIVASFFAVLLDGLYYRGFYNFINSERTLQSLSASTEERIALFESSYNIDFSEILFQNVIPSFVFISIALLLIVALFAKIKNKDSFSLLKEYAWFILPVYLCAILLLNIAPFVDLRYIYPFFLVMAILFPLLMSSMSNVVLRSLISIGISCVFIFSAIKGDGIFNKYDYSYPSKISHLEYNKELPIYVDGRGLLLNIDTDQDFCSIGNLKERVESVKGKGGAVFILMNAHLYSKDKLEDAGIGGLEPVAIEYGFSNGFLVYIVK